MPHSHYPKCWSSNHCNWDRMRSHFHFHCHFHPHYSSRGFPMVSRLWWYITLRAIDVSGSGCALYENLTVLEMQTVSRKRGRSRVMMRSIPTRSGTKENAGWYGKQKKQICIQRTESRKQRPKITKHGNMRALIYEPFQYWQLLLPTIRPSIPRAPNPATTTAKLKSKPIYKPFRMPRYTDTAPEEVQHSITSDVLYCGVAAEWF